MSAQQPMVNLTIDGQAVSVPKGTTVYTAATQMGIQLPIFCYQDRMPPFGACRVCLVEVEKMPKLQTSCTLEATEGMVVKTQSQIAKEGREIILEYLLINHPLDCPICDRGGECPLQDQAYSDGPGKSRFFEDKRHFPKPVPRGPVLMLDRERCVVCARCTRFGDLIAGDHALEFIDRGFKTEVGTPDGGPAESKFIGNTIMICPVGALTSQVYRFRARPWDNDSTNSTCTLCPVGCSMILDARDGEIVRTRSQENRDVNDIWMCDKGWFGYEFTYNQNRLQSPLVRRGSKLEPASWEEAISLIASKIVDAKPNGKLAALGGNPLTTEENYLFQKLMREGAGVNNLDHRVGMPVFTPDEEGLEPGMEMSIGDCENLSYAILFGLDLTEEFPVIWLRLRQAINRGAKILFFGNYSPEIAPYVANMVLHTPGKELETINQHISEISKLAHKGKNGALFVGSQYLNSPKRRAILSELLKLKKSNPNLTLNLLEGRGNCVGARYAGMFPTSGPYGEMVKPGLNALQLLEATTKNGWDFLYVAGANPARKYPAKLWKEVRSKLGFLVVHELFLTETAQQADVVLPTLSYVEKGGSFVNIEGRVQKLLPGKEIPENIFTDGEIFARVAEKLSLPLDIDLDFAETLSPGRLALERIDHLGAISASPRHETPLNGKLAASFAHQLFDNGVRMKHNPHVIKLAKEPKVRIHPVEGAKRGIQNGDMVRVTANGNSIPGKVKLDKGVSEGVVVLPLGFDQLPVHELGVNLLNGMPVEVSRT